MSNDFWVDALSVGVAKFDAAHREQLNLIGRIEESFGNGQRAEALVSLHRLQIHLERHQAEELDLLLRTAYPGIDHIHQIQRATIDRLRQLISEAERGSDLDEAGRQATQMRMAFVDYLLKGDLDFKSHLEMCGHAHS
ncbi:MAG: hypothetical protein HY055_03875 [Magnetospirillum sp.]|nr:hypothetical protein [Magnetospirillum sp.]